MPEWVQSKITLATDYIQTAADYMYSEMKEETEMNEASSAALRLQKALQRAKEQREREERAGAALLKPKPPVQDEPPFEGPYKKTPSAVAGKYGSGYSTARHLARQALQKQAEKYKPVKESLEESRKAEIVKEIIKKKKAKSEDAFQSEPELSSTLTKV